MAEKRTFEANTFACKTFACGSFANNQQQIQFIQARTMNQPTSVDSVDATTYPTDFSVVYTGVWEQATVQTGATLLIGRAMSSGSNALLSERLMNEPDDTENIPNDLILLGTTTGTSALLGMGVSGVTDNVEQPKAFNARLMKEPK